VVSLLIVVLVAPGCAQQETEEMSPAELYTLIQSESPPLILDVRTLGEYRAGHVPGALHRPFYELLRRAPQVPASVDAPLIVYCEHGPRASIAAWGLRRSGFSRVVSLEGHMAAWKKRNLPVESGVNENDNAD
jgi:hydroxyacylglutathione hydrolase